MPISGIVWTWVLRKARFVHKIVHIAGKDGQVMQMSILGGFIGLGGINVLLEFLIHFLLKVFHGML